jgi:hypothetical protein
MPAFKKSVHQLVASQATGTRYLISRKTGGGHHIIGLLEAIKLRGSDTLTDHATIS